MITTQIFKQAQVGNRENYSEILYLLFYQWIFSHVLFKYLDQSYGCKALL